uniref:Uncharacterized protein n=1 Tax=Timema bartmani TaxID=61472 RepID=A0A7R9EYJ5_9NEOP|nr:unnamed protein product [Timema bartmani]
MSTISLSKFEIELGPSKHELRMKEPSHYLGTLLANRAVLGETCLEVNHTGDERPPDAVGVADIGAALQDRAEFDLLTNAGLGCQSTNTG